MKMNLKFLIYIIVIVIFSSSDITNTNNTSVNAIDINNVSSLPLCNHHHHINGTWIKVNHTRKSFYCCSWDNNDYLNMKDYCEQGIVSDTNFFNGNTNYSSQCGAHSCKCDSFGNRLNTNERENYEWVPSNCTLMKFDGQLFCNIVKNRTILLVGDSTMLQTSVTLMSMITSYGGNCADQIYFGLSNWVVAESPGTLVDYVDKIKPDIIIVNIGAWTHDLNQFRGYYDGIMQTIETIRQKEYYTNKKPLVFWKGQNPGHIKCEDHATRPYNGDEYFNNLEHIPWGWHEHRNFDKYAISKAKEHRVTVIDLWPLFQRPDAHTFNDNGNYDCLHYCLPGPLDIFSNILLQLLYHHSHS